MTLPRQLASLHMVVYIKMTWASIAGVTYMDNFDFEARYRNPYECDPFYWHPLHMPEHCTTMFEKLIRKGVGRYGPVRIVKERKTKAKHSYYKHSSTEYNEYYDDVDDDVDDDEEEEYDTMAPYEKMMKLIEADVRNEPTAAKITVMPGLGPIALYRQPVSKISGDYIKEVAQVYRQHSFGYAPLYNPIKPEYEKHIIDGKKKKKKKDINKARKKNKKNGKYNIKKKIDKNGLLTILHTRRS